MNEQVKAAIDKVRELSGDITDVLNLGVPHDSMTYRGSLLWDLLDAAIVLQKACIDFNPPDDGERTAKEWMLAVGWEQDPTDDDFLQIAITGDQKLSISMTDWSLAAIEGVGVGKIDLTDWVPLGNATAETRGKVRRLCSAIGTPLKETK
jgi:hypothetical protein